MFKRSSKPAIALLTFAMISGQVVVATNASAATLEVTSCDGATNTPTPGTLTPGTLPYAVYNAADNDIITITATCDESSPILLDAPLEISASNVTITSPSAANAVIKRGFNKQDQLTDLKSYVGPDSGIGLADPLADPLVEGLTNTKFIERYYRGAMIEVSSDLGSLTLSGVTLDGNSSNGYLGRAIDVTPTATSNSSVSFALNITDSKIKNNSLGLADVCSSAFTPASVTAVDGIDSAENFASESGVFGFHKTCDVYLDGDYLDASGAAVFASEAGVSVNLSASTITDNFAKGTGAGVVADRVSVTNSRFTNNTALDDTNSRISPMGAAIYALNKIQTSGSVFEDNTSTSGSGGAIANMTLAEMPERPNGLADEVTNQYNLPYSHEYLRVHGDDCYPGEDESVTHCNLAIWTAEPAEHVGGPEINLELTGTTFTNNLATAFGGAVYSEGSARLINNTFFKNVGTSVGSDIYLHSSATLAPVAELINNTFAQESTNPETVSLSINTGTTVHLIANLIVGNCDVALGTWGDYNHSTSSTCVGEAYDAKTALVLDDGLRLNGNSGIAKTYAIGLGSAAINALTGPLQSDNNYLSEVVPTLDQRGVTRNINDAGAFEYDPNNTASIVTDSPTGNQPAGPVTIKGIVTPKGMTLTEGTLYLTTTPGQPCESGTSFVAPGDITGNPNTADLTKVLNTLSPDTTYYFCTSARTSFGYVIYGEVKSFRTAPLNLDLQLNLGATRVLAGASTTASGSGLQPDSMAYLYQYSARKLVASFNVNGQGNFSGSFVVTTCDGAGDHKFRIEGLAPDGSPVSAEVYYVLDPNCIAHADATIPLQSATITVEDVLFPNRSAKLSAKYKALLDAWVPLLTSANRIKVDAYTETKQKTQRAIKWCVGLSNRRALAVQKYLRSKGVNVTFTLIGHGATNPKSAIQPLNRRASITLETTYGR